ncbi:hypothetical protein HBA_0582 [Sodalis endosymbiont of Henestaris halophilus]|nr:hypothetical protein HBA_0582 [Sodalis endosymbiont of Henestaris halophilus]
MCCFASIDDMFNPLNLYRGDLMVRSIYCCYQNLFLNRGGFTCQCFIGKVSDKINV